METINLGIDDDLPPVDWSTIVERIADGSPPAPDAHNARTTWLTTLNEDGSPWLFFDLENDPLEMRNLVGEPQWVDEIREMARSVWAGGCLAERSSEFLDKMAGRTGREGAGTEEIWAQKRPA